MAIFGPPNRRIEVRVIKLPGNPDDLTKPVYFDEYVPLGDMRIPEETVTLRIIPEDVLYGIEVTFKAGFQHGEFNSVIGLRLKDKTSKVKLYDRYTHWVEKNSTHFSKDTTFFITTLPDVVIDGKKMTNVKLAFNDLVPDKSLPFKSGTPGFKAEELSGLVLEILRDNDWIKETMPEHEYQLQLAKYNMRMASQAMAPAPMNTLKAVEDVDEETFNKHGVSHEIKLAGGMEVKNLPHPPSREIRRTDKREEKFVHILFRSPVYMKTKKLHKTPIPDYLQPWELLNDYSRRLALKYLQNHDKEKTAIFKVAKAGNGADPKKVRKELFDSLPVVDRWRSWHFMVAREREGHFKRLQARLHHWSDQEGKTPSTWIEPAKCTESEMEEEEEDNHSPSPLVIRNGVVIIDESPPRNSKRTLSASNADSNNIKLEPSDLDLSVNTSSDIPRPAKKVKKATKQPKLDSKLARLKAQEKLLEEEMLLVKKRRELLAAIEAEEDNETDT